MLVKLKMKFDRLEGSQMEFEFDRLEDSQMEFEFDRLEGSQMEFEFDRLEDSQIWQRDCYRQYACVCMLCMLVYMHVHTCMYVCIALLWESVRVFVCVHQKSLAMNASAL